MLNLDDKMQGYIEQAIHDLEKNSYGEVVCVVARSSANYRLFPILIAVIISFFIIPMFNLNILLSNIIKLDDWLLNIIINLVSFSFILSLLLFTPLAVLVTPKRIKHACAKRFAWEQFFSNNLHHAKKRSGVLIFISITERYAHIIGDKGINDELCSSTWADILNDLIKSIKNGKLGEGLLYCITQLKTIMVKSFPTSRERIKDLPDSVVYIDKTTYIS